jgi:hypothetical protein
MHRGGGWVKHKKSHIFVVLIPYNRYIERTLNENLQIFFSKIFLGTRYINIHNILNSSLKSVITKAKAICNRKLCEALQLHFSPLSSAEIFVTNYHHSLTIFVTYSSAIIQLTSRTNCIRNEITNVNAKPWAPLPFLSIANIITVIMTVVVRQFSLK